ncbi:hypothetical protein ACLMJK_005282 [Lecanora helva]
MPRRSTRARVTLTSAPSPPPSAQSTRPRRTASGSTVKISRDDSNSPDESKKALRLTMKMPSSKLREATSDPKSRSGPRGNAVTQLTDSLTGGEIVSGPRTSRTNKKYVVESESDDEESEGAEEDEIQPSEDEQEDDEDEEDQIGGPEESDDEDVAGDDEDEDAEDNLDADGDIDMEENIDDPQATTAQQPILKVNGPAAKEPPKASSKPTVTLTPAQADKLKSVEAKEIEMDDDDEELSELSEDDEEDAEGDVDEEMGDEDDESRSPGSRDSTPDVSKMTKRQRSRLDQVMGGDFLQLPMEPQIKKHLTAEEHAMRRAEMARRRKNLSEKRNEDEKRDTINRLLKKQAPKRRGKISAAEITAQEHSAADETSAEPQEEEILPANPVFVRWISDKNGCRLGVPGEWLGQPGGRVFGARKMVEEVEE